MISSWVIDFAPCRIAVPRQSAPVSPPPMMTTCLPAAVIWFSTGTTERDPVGLGQELHRLVDPAQLPARHRQVPTDGGTGGEHDRVVPLP